MHCKIISILRLRTLYLTPNHLPMIKILATCTLLFFCLTSKAQIGNWQKVGPNNEIFKNQIWTIDESTNTLYFYGIINPAGSLGRVYTYHEGVWDSLPGDIYASLSAMHFYNGKLYLSGNIGINNTAFSSRLIRYNPATWWEEVGFFYGVNSLHTIDDTLYASCPNCLFQLNDTLNGIIKYNELTNRWSEVDGINDVLPNDEFYWALGVVNYNNELYVAGNMYSPSNSIEDLVVCKDGNCHNQGYQSQSGFDMLYGAKVMKNKLYTYGWFSMDAGNIGNGIVSYNGSYWENLHGGGMRGFNYNGNTWITYAEVYNDELYVTGNFNVLANQIEAYGLAKYDGDNWYSYPTTTGADSIIFATMNGFFWYDDSLYVLSTQPDSNGLYSGASLFKYDGVFQPNDSTNFPTTVKEIAISGFTLYPNPATHDYVQIEGAENQQLTLNIYDITGMFIKKVSVNSNQGNLFVGDLPTGVYIFKDQSTGFCKRLVIL